MAARCSICKSAVAAPDNYFDQRGYLYHERCLPACGDCGGAITPRNCARVWKDQDWIAKHRICPADEKPVRGT